MDPPEPPGSQDLFSDGEEAPNKKQSVYCDEVENSMYFQSKTQLANSNFDIIFTTICNM